MTSSVRQCWGHHAKRFCRSLGGWSNCIVCMVECTTCFGPNVQATAAQMVLSHGAPLCVHLCEWCFQIADDAWLEAKCAELWLAGLEA